MIEQFKNISMRGRVAYGILCLESTLNSEEKFSKGWKLVLERLWSYTEIKYLDEWQDKTLEILPSSIMEIENFEEEDLEYVSQTEFDVLKSLYGNANNMVLDMIEVIFYIGTLELFGSISNGAIQSLKQLEKLLSIMNSIPVEPPAIGLVRRYSFQEENGWGTSFNKKEIITPD